MSRPSDFAEIRRTSRRPVGGTLVSHRCFCCFASKGLSNHHITPRDDGGTDSHRNKVTLCNQCHDQVEGLPWTAILAYRARLRWEREESEDWLNRKTPGSKLWSVRAYCLERGILHPMDNADDFRQAFRTTNLVYNTLRSNSGTDGSPQEIKPRKSHPRYDGAPPMSLRPSAAARARAEIDRLLWEGTQEEWVASIVSYANRSD